MNLVTITMVVSNPAVSKTCTVTVEASDETTMVDRIGGYIEGLGFMTVTNTL